MALATHDTWRFSVRDLWRMKETGVLPEDVRVELLDGEVAPMAPEGSEHGSLVTRLQYALIPAVGARADFWSQSSLRLDDITLVQPDLALLRRRADTYYGRIPIAEDVLLAIEVSHGSLARDRLVKAPLYARAGVPELWLVRIADRRIEVLRDPSPDGYRSSVMISEAGRAAVAMLDGVSIAVRDLFPPSG